MVAWFDGESRFLSNYRLIVLLKVLYGYKWWCLVNQLMIKVCQICAVALYLYFYSTGRVAYKTTKRKTDGKPVYKGAKPNPLYGTTDDVSLPTHQLLNPWLADNYFKLLLMESWLGTHCNMLAVFLFQLFQTAPFFIVK